MNSIIGDLAITITWAIGGLLLLPNPIGFLLIMGAVFYLIFSEKVDRQTSYLKQIADFYQKIDKEVRESMEKEEKEEEEEEVEIGKFAIGPFRPDQMPAFIKAIEETLTKGNPHVQVIKTHSAPVVCDNCGHGFCLNCEARKEIAPQGNTSVGRLVCPSCRSPNYTKKVKTEEGE